MSGGWLGVGVLAVGMLVVARGLARVPLGWGRGGAWLATVAAVVLAEWLLAGDVPLVRMAGLSLALLAGMKTVVYVEWSRAGARRLGLWRHLGFGLLWVGMDPGVFARPGMRLASARMLAEGSLITLAGVGLVVMVDAAGWRSVWGLFIPLSVAFHFGALRVLAGLWRAAGVPAKPLFRNPLGAASAADFWARRWNLGYAQMMAIGVARPLAPLLGAKRATFVVFIVSGIFHEVAITLPVRAGFGWPTLTFILYGLVASRDLPPWPLPLRRALTAISILLPLPWLFPPAFRAEVLVPITTAIARLLAG